MTEYKLHNVRLTILGEQQDLKDDTSPLQKTEQRLQALLYEYGDNNWELQWTEEDSDGQTRCRAAIRPGLLELHREGAVRTHMEIREGQETSCTYQTAMGTLPMTIRAERVAVRRSASALIIRAAYALPSWGLHSVVTLRAEFMR